MAKLWIRWLGRIAISIGIGGAALALPWVDSNSWFQRWWLSRQWNGWTLIAIAIDAALVLVAAIWWLWWRLPRRQVTRLSIQIPDPKARADAEDNFRKTVGQALGGVAVLIGAGVAYLQFTQQQQASHDLLISNQVSKGFEQLAGKETAMRLGGIYALEGVMNTSEQYHRSVLEALCAFVRDGTIGKTVNEDGPAIDIQAALTVIGRRKAPEGLVQMDLAAANIPKADLRSAHLYDAILTRANLRRANLIDANLTDANLIGADLRGAYLIDADLRGAYLNGADLRGAYLNGANLTDANRILNGDANLIGANLSGADLSEAKLNQIQLNGSCGTDARLPKGLTLPKGPTLEPQCAKWITP